MSMDYNGARLTAKSIISFYGKAGQVIKKGATGGYIGGDLIADTPDIVIDGIITPRLNYKTDEIDGTQIIKGDGYCFFHSDEAVKVGMQTTLNGITYRIESIKPLDSVDDINVFRKLQLRV